MFTHERRRALLDLLERKRRVTNGELLRALRVSPATLRRDLADLEAGGRLVRFHGGAAHPLYLRAEPSLEQRSRRAVGEKRAMAEAAAGLVPPQQTVLLDAGTSCLEVGRLLMERSDLTIVCNSVAFAEAARAGAAARVICLGGELRPVSSALVGALALAWLDNVRADVAFLGASGLAEDGASTTELSEGAVKQAMLARAARKILVADAGKWGRPSLVRFGAWAAFDAWVTSAEISATATRAVSALGPEVIVARTDREAKGQEQPQGKRR
jgi:DeoR/GlpR family transcriptional regulator of sugar metabolism